MNKFIDGQGIGNVIDLFTGLSGGKQPHWMRGPTRPIIGTKPVAKAMHFKSHAARAKAQAALDALKSKGGELSREDIGRILAPHTHWVPVWRGATKETAARITEILAPKKETTDAPRK